MLFIPQKCIGLGLGMPAQVVECLPSKYLALSTNPHTAKKKKMYWLYLMLGSVLCLWPGRLSAPLEPVVWGGGTLALCKPEK
jgi:hypothetical protein